MIKILIISIIFSVASLRSLKAQDFTFSKSISKNNIKLIQDDLEYLKTFDFYNISQKSHDIFEVHHFDGHSIYQWLNKRVSYFAEESILSHTNVYYFESLYKTALTGRYPTPEIITYSLNSENNPFDFFSGPNQEMIISNLGASLYVKGKIENKIYHAKLNPKAIRNKIDLAILSPRIGLLRVGRGFFGKSVIINKKDLTLKSNRISRLSILAHEGRHSDGNASSLSFAHSQCPSTHYLYGKEACDDSTNGPYTVGAQLALEMLKAEKSLSSMERETLKMIILDNQSRVPSVNSRGTAPIHWDTKAESIKK